MRALQFQKKLFGVITLFLLLLFSLISIVAGVYLFQNSMENENKLQIENMKAVSSSLDQLIDDMNSLSQQLMANSTIQKEFLKAYNSNLQDNFFENYAQDKTALGVECSAINSSKKSVDSIYIYNPPYDFYSYNIWNYTKKNISKILQSEELREYVDCGDNYYKVIGPHNNPWVTDDDSCVISLIRPLNASYLTREDVGVLEVQNNYSKVERICNSTVDDLAIMVVDNESGGVIYSEENTISSEEGRLIEAGVEKTQLIKNENGEKKRVCAQILENCNWKVIAIQNNKNYMHSARLIVLLIAGIFILFGAVTAIAMFIITRKLTQPIRNLRASLETVTLDDVDIRGQYEGNNEIELLQKKFQQVLNALQDSARKVAISQTAEYQAKIIALQAKINPHFLYNSLMSISAAGQERDAEKIQQMCSQLSDIFRYASSDGMETSLEEELENILNYLKFMKWRYLDELQYQIDGCEKMKEIGLPKLTLQPLIENCFVHGFYSVEPPYFIYVHCWREEGKWFVQIEDNGGGFSEESLNALKKMKQDIDSQLQEGTYSADVKLKHMAIMNVYARLKLRYKDGLIFEIGNKGEKGAVIVIGGKL